VRGYTGGTGFNTPTNTKDALLFTNDGPIPYLVFVTDAYNNVDTGSIYSNQSPRATTIRTTGTLYKGSFSRSGLSAGFHMIPNPYPSPLLIDDNVTFTNAHSQYWVWDPKSGGGVGNYQTIDPIFGEVEPGGGSYPNPDPPFLPAVSDTSNVIPTGSAFWIRVDAGGNGGITINESNKGGSNFLSLTGRTQTNLPPYLKTSLYNNGTLLKDGVGVAFVAGASASVDKSDAPKFSIGSEAISIRRSNSNLSIEYRPLLTLNDTIFLRLHNMQQTMYRFLISGKRFDVNPGVNAFLLDAYLGTETPLSLTTANTINFNVDANAESTGDRFRIVFRIGVVTSVSSNNALKGIQVYPNPISAGSALGLYFKNIPPATYQYRIYNAVGIQMANGVLQHSGGSMMHRITLPEQANGGIYLLEISDKKGNDLILKVTIQ
jgi:hypothetical protein